MEKQKPIGTVKEAASAMQDAARDSKAAADQAASQAGETLKSAADQLRARLPETGMVGEMADRVTSGVKDAATHLQEEGFGGMVEDVVAIVRRYPMQTFLLGLGCGFLLSRFRRE
ncbi:MAG: hypothetical protein ACXWV7_04950 [Nitrospira sp.]